MEFEINNFNFVSSELHEPKVEHTHNRNKICRFSRQNRNICVKSISLAIFFPLFSNVYLHFS